MSLPHDMFMDTSERMTNNHAWELSLIGAGRYVYFLVVFSISLNFVLIAVRTTSPSGFLGLHFKDGG